MAAFYMDNIQNPANSPDCFLGKVTQLSESELREAR